MDVYGWVALSFGAMIAAVVMFCGYVIIKQQRTIDRLTDKLMAKDYGEYKRLGRVEEREEKPKRKPMSFYDDSSVDPDEIQ